jgi:hypothetical protein
MTISSTVRVAGPFVGNGTASVFPYAFKIFAATDLDVIRLASSTGVESTLVLNSDYSVTLNGDQNSNPGGSITLLAGALASGFTLTITSDIANLQPTDLTNQGGFYPEVITDSLDRATIQIQQISDIGDRTLKIPISDGTGLDMELPTAAQRANSFLAFDSSGEPTVLTAGTSGAPATITRQVFSGTGSQTVFTLASDPGGLGNSAQIYIGGVYQQRSTYTIIGTTLTFSAAPVAGTDNIEFINFLTDNVGSVSADLVTYTPTGTGAVARSAASKFVDIPSVVDYGAVADGTTDNTATILAAAVSSGRKLLLIPYNVKYNRSTLLASVTLPDDVVFIDWSGINDFSAAGETTKHFGIVSRDSAPDDTHFAVDSGHHAIINLNNFGTAGTVSATERKATIAWSSGQFALGPSNKQGFRGAALEQFTKSSGSNHWIKGLRSLAPWVAINGNYERWASGQVIAATGVYRTSSDQHYVSASTGTTGSTAPSHTSGTVSDGGVDWTWVDSADRTVWLIREDGRVGIGNTSFAATWRHKVSTVDASGDYSFEGEATGASKVAVLKLIPTNAGSAVLPTPFLRADANGLNVMRSDASTNIVRFTDAEGMIARELVLVFTSNASTGATPSVDGISVLSVENSGATTITGFTGGSEGQFIHLYFLNANTTLQTSVTFTLTGSVNVTPTSGSVVTMMKVPPGISNRWVEVSRSIK